LAKDLVDGDPTAAAAIKEGDPEVTIKTAHAEMKARKAREDEKQRQKERLKEEAPALYDDMESEKITYEQALAKLAHLRSEKARLEQEAEDDKKVATGNLSRIVGALYPRGAPEKQWAKQMFEDVDNKYWPREFSFPLNADTIKMCAGVLLALAQNLENGK
jgi:hypothetical protein